MRARRAVPVVAALVVAMLLPGGHAAAQRLPRVEHVSRALDAVRALGPAERERLDRELYAAARAQCRAEAQTPTVTCLIGAARAACAAHSDRARCEAAADVIVTNLRATGAWVDEPTRVRMVRGSTDYRAALTAELRRRYAALAAELVLGGQAAARDAAARDAAARDAAARDAAAISTLCEQRDREIHACEPGDAACVPSLPWSRCVAALVWFVGGGP
jgi:hypothetical protein